VREKRTEMTQSRFRNKRLAMARGDNPRLIAAVAETLVIERERWMLWLPVAFGAGIAVYFRSRRCGWGR